MLEIEYLVMSCGAFNPRFLAKIKRSKADNSNHKKQQMCDRPLMAVQRPLDSSVVNNSVKVRVDQLKSQPNATIR